jgi:hypothetical protein
VVNNQFSLKEYKRLMDPTPFEALSDWSSRNLPKKEIKEFMKELLHQNVNTTSGTLGSHLVTAP